MRFSVLGPLTLATQAGPVGLGSTKRRTLLAVLLSRNGQAVSSGALIDALWDDAPPETATTTLRWHVHQLRRLLDDPARIAWDGHGYRLTLEPGELDADDFDALNRRALAEPDNAADLLHQALALWHGPAFGDLGAHPALVADATRLDELRITALEHRISADLALGRHHHLLAELGSLTAEHPYRERLHAQHLLALHRAGHRDRALAAFATVRQLLADGLGLDPGPELRSLHRAILDDDPGLRLTEAAGAAVTPPGPALPAPAELPADTATFTGRSADLVRLRDRLTTRTGPVVISAITGSGGIGKSALAVHAAHQISGEFPDGQLYVDLRGSTPGVKAVEPHEALSRLLRSLGVPDDAIPRGIDEAAARYRSVTHGKRLLILLDNASDTAQIRPLLPGHPESAVLITSRRRLSDLDNAIHHPLDVLAPAESFALLERLLGRHRVRAESGSAEELARLCGHLPLALRIAAARLSTRPTWTVGILTARLAAEGERLPQLRAGDLDLAATLSVSYHELDAHLARTYRLCSLPNGPDLSVDAAGALLGLPESETEDHLETLCDLSLLESPGSGRYRYHDLLRLHARAQAAEADSPRDHAAALHNLLDHYCATARNAVDTLDRHWVWPESMLVPESPGRSFSTEDAAWTWLRRQSGTPLTAAIEQASGTTGHTLGLAADLVYGVVSGKRGGLLWGDVRGLADTIGDIGASAADQGDRRSEAIARYLLGELAFALHDLPRAAREVDRAVDLSRNLGDRVLLANTLHAQGGIRRALRNPHAALAAFEEAASIRRDLEDWNGEALDLANLTRPLHDVVGPDAALAGLGRAAVAAAKGGDHKALAKVLYERGILERGLGRFAEAAKDLRDALPPPGVTTLTSSVAYTLYHLAETHRLAGDMDSAVHCAEECIRASHEIGGAFNAARALAVLGMARSAQGDPEQGREHLEEALQIFTRLGAPEAEEIRAILGLTAVQGTHNGSPV